MVKNKKMDLSIINFDEDDKQLKYVNKSKFVPQWCFRWCIIGQSGSGKTVLALNAIARMLVYDKLYIIQKNPDQSKIKKLTDAFKEAGREMDLILGTGMVDIPKPDDFDKTKQNLVLLDDLVNEPDQSRIIELAIMGRHKGVSLIYLTQSYYKIPRIIRLQATDFSIFELNRKETRLIYDDVGQACESLDLFRRMMMDSTTKDYGFLQIDMRTRNPKYKFRRGLDRDIHTGGALT